MLECPKCHRRIKSINAWHYCAQVDINSLFKGKPEEIELIFDKVLAEIIDWENVDVSATKNCIVFVKSKTFLIAKPMQKALDLKFYLDESTQQPFVYSCSIWNKKYEIHVRLSQLEELSPQLIQLIRKAYTLS